MDKGQPQTVIGASLPQLALGCQSCLAVWLQGNQEHTSTQPALLRFCFRPDLHACRSSPLLLISSRYSEGHTVCTARIRASASHVVAASADRSLRWAVPPNTNSSSFTSLLSLLEGRGGQVTPAAEDFLTKNAARLGRCYNPFREPSAASKAKLDSGKIVGRDGGQSIELKPQEKDLAKQISEKLVLDEVEAALLLRAYRQHRGEGVDKDVEAILSKDEAFWSSITGFVFEERSSVLQVVAFLLRTGESGSLGSAQPAQDVPCQVCLSDLDLPSTFSLTQRTSKKRLSRTSS